MKNYLGITFLLIVSIGIVEGHKINDFPLPSLFGLYYNIFINGLTYLLGIFKVFKLPDRYYRINGFEKQGEIYKYFGVDIIRKLLKFSGTVLFDGKKSSLARLQDKMLFAEKNHAICFSLNFFTMAYLAVSGLWGLIPSVLIFNFLLNFYPIITQRYNRARIQKITRSKGINQILTKGPV